MPWFPSIAERDHFIQNPTSPDKIRLLGSYLRLDPSSRVLDVACGQAGPAIVLAETFGCHVLAVERFPQFVRAGRERIVSSSLEGLIDIVQADARDFTYDDEAFDAALCLGASFVWNGLEGALEALTPAVPADGHVIVGEPFWQRWPLPSGVDDEGFTALSGIAERFQEAGLRLTGLIASSEEDWDRYESLHWRAVEDWLATNPADPDAPEIRRIHQDFLDRYVGFQRGALGWAIVIGRKGR